MSEEQISLKTVYNLRVDPSSERPIHYRIPAYQRGFRWSSTQVAQLLDDIRDFANRENPQPEEFYCLQPLVLRATPDGSYEVVDGQQRLTTLFLVLRHFNERLTERYRQPVYVLEYETRLDFLEFLENRSETQVLANVDFFHIDQAIRTIESWFENRESEVETIKAALLNKAKVIWFTLSPGDNPVAAFTRLNVGKIPLTNGELIRALFLRWMPADTATASPRLRIAYEWDMLEKALQRGEFWGFLSNDTTQRGNRIDFLFTHVARADGMQLSQDDYATFYHFSGKLNARTTDPEQEWLAVKQAFMLLEEWFEDRHLYHLVGFLIYNNVDINHIRALARETAKKAFKDKLRAKIWELTIRSPTFTSLSPADARQRISEYIDKLQYGSNSKALYTTLLLFNVATLLLNSKSNMRFQFDSFKAAHWDLEHVRSVASDRPGNRKDQLEWLDSCLVYLRSADEAPELREAIETFATKTTAEATDVDFEDLYEQILQHFHESDGGDPDNSVSNLVLLDSGTNRSYKNAVFAVKRARVLSLDQDGVFVPSCTRNVFLKCYNPRVDHLMFWTPEDKLGYRQRILDTLDAFFMGDWIHG